MSDFIQYTQWRQREESMTRELEQARAAAMRLAEDGAERPEPARTKARTAPEKATASHAIHRAAVHQR
jgi:hypothetical protein